MLRLTISADSTDDNEIFDPALHSPDNPLVYRPHPSAPAALSRPSLRVNTDIPIVSRIPSDAAPPAQEARPQAEVTVIEKPVLGKWGVRKAKTKAMWKRYRAWRKKRREEKIAWNESLQGIGCSNG
ncbi:hypothetical protein DPSP01_003774 [Paraphaeosphaeria sporulosa]